MPTPAPNLNLASRVERTDRHFARRLEQRHGVTLTPAETARIVRGILLGQAQLIRKQLARRHMYLVALRGKLVGVVYDWTYKTIVTVMPDDDLRVQMAASALSLPMKKWLRESQQAVKGTP